MTTIRTLATQLDITIGDIRAIVDGTDPDITDTWWAGDETEFAAITLTADGVEDITDFVATCEPYPPSSTQYRDLAAEALDHEGTEAYFGPLAERLIEAGGITRRILIGILAEELATAEVYIPTDTSVTIPDAVVTACTARLTERYSA